MDINGIWILILGILALPGAAVITRWMSPVGNKAMGLLAGILGGIIGIVVLEVIAGLPAIMKPAIAGVDALGAAVVSFFLVSAASASAGLLVNWLLYSMQTRNNSPEEALAE
ncbi:MAG TPA: hypothetical protein VH599_15270 [Ktedonobacterales bacterium]|jgi:hypothetical protein